MSRYTSINANQFSGMDQNRSYKLADWSAVSVMRKKKRGFRLILFNGNFADDEFSAAAITSTGLNPHGDLRRLATSRQSKTESLGFGVVPRGEGLLWEDAEPPDLTLLGSARDQDDAFDRASHRGLETRDRDDKPSGIILRRLTRRRDRDPRRSVDAGARVILFCCCHFEGR
ncbi:hypothetical protein [Nitrobacter winogradskyi]|uniref:Uncharacterized protein n=2 Tax=Nitrobacter winogradskyi TaxID=913 RepID=A0ACC6AHS1_NITWI|nr:hypothetical protein [Nitrobacter winogradskyi]MCP1999053.1 hypothetical protein [Nitrobacter winogradskyi]GEC16431.1 hypothetical protein NWI01_23230 [Nitrobacter winogradskyi]